VPSEKASRTALRVALIALLLSVAVHASTDSASMAVDTLAITARPVLDSTIREINLVGNNHTKAWVVHAFLALDTGKRYDSAAIEAAETRLYNTRLFGSVKILRVVKPEGTNLYVVMQEAPRFMLTDIGGGLYILRYGHTDPLWRLWRANLTGRINNLGGRMEAINIALSVWEWRQLYVSWYKPFLPRPWYLIAGAGMSSMPYTGKPWRAQVLRATLATGYRLNHNARVYCSLVPRYHRNEYHGPQTSGRYTVYAAYDTTTLDPDSAVFSIDDQSHDTSWTDVVRITSDTVETRVWKGNALWEADQRDQRFSEIRVAIGGTIEKKDRNYPHRNGIYWGHDLSLNVPLTGDSNTALFGQYSTDIQFHHPGFPRRTSLAYRAQVTVRLGDGGRFHYLESGGEHTVHGFGLGAIGVRSRSNNSACFNLEYRFPIVKTPEMTLPKIANIVVPTRRVYYRIDGALFADFAYHWHEIQHPLTLYEHGTAIGAALRITLPSARRAACIDVAPLLLYQGEMFSRWSDTRTWGFNAYVDMVF
jgi:outer membrane protein assembly factor BamA